MQPIGFKCPNCGAPISSPTQRCKYCGTHFMLRDNMVTLTSSYECPECGISVGTGSFICVNCGKVLTTDPKELSILRAEQKRIRFFHDERLNSLPKEVQHKLKTNEYVYCVVEGKHGVKSGTKKHFIVTDQGIIMYHEEGVFRKTPIVLEYPYDDIAGLAYEDEVDLDFTLVGVRTFNEKENLTISFPLFSSEAEIFKISFEIAFENHRLQRKDIMAVLCFANV